MGTPIALGVAVAGADTAQYLLLCSRRLSGAGRAAAGAAWRRRGRWARVPGFVRTVVTARVPLLVALIFAAFQLPGQVPEILWGWLDVGSVALLGVLFPILLALSLGHLPVAALVVARIGQKLDSSPAGHEVAAGQVRHLVVGVMLLLIAAFNGSLKPLLPVGLVLLVGLLGLALRGWPEVHRVKPPELGSTLLPPLLAGFMLISWPRACCGRRPILCCTTGCAMLTCRVSGCCRRRACCSSPPPSWSCCSGVTPSTALDIACPRDAGREDRTTRRNARRAARGRRTAPGPRTPLIALMVGLVVWLVVPGGSVTRSGCRRSRRVLGRLGSVRLSLGLVTLIGSSVVALVDWAMPRPPRIFRPTPLDRTPVVLFVIAWLVLASSLPPYVNGHIHDVRRMRRRPPRRRASRRRGRSSWRRPSPTGAGRTAWSPGRRATCRPISRLCRSC